MLFFGGLGCQTEDEPKPRQMIRGDAAMTLVDAAPVGPSLYERLGGKAGIEGIVANFAAAAHGHPELAPYFMNADVDGVRLTACLELQLSALTGGRDDQGRAFRYPGDDARCRDMRTIHAGMGITYSLFDITVDALAGELVAAGANDADLVALGRVLRGLQDKIVSPTDPEGEIITYHRLGGLPGIRTAVTVFVTAVAGDEDVNDFFTDLDEEGRVRFETCLSRQICMLTGGPCIYGAEVDGIPGVSAAEPCKDMVTAHRDLTDTMDRPITGDHFVALIDILIEVLTELGVPTPDIGMIVSAIAPTCRDIAGDPTGCPGRDPVPDPDAE